MGGAGRANGAGDAARDVRVAIFGGGLSGIGATAMLRRAGIDDVVVFERAEEVGGTWRDNTYPGCACDVPSALYSFSFAPNPAWGRVYAGQREIQEYARHVADAHGVRDHVVTGAEVLSAVWEHDAQRWRIETTRGTWRARAIVSATGPWSEPVLPQVPGLERFAGKVFHSSRWDHGHDLGGRRVAVIGTGASAVQFVPQIQPRVAQATVYQRTAQWVLPKLDRRVTSAERALYRRVPLTQRALREAMYYSFELAGYAERHPRAMGGFQRIARRHLERSVQDPALRAALTPDHTLGCKRILFSNDWYRSLTRPNVELVPHAVTEIRADGLVAADGVERPADTLILGTGFGITEMPIASRVTGRDGRTLDETWGGSPTGYLGTVISGFPNFFMVLGPNVGNGHTSATVLIELQVRFAIDALKRMERDGIASADVRPAVQEAFNQEVQRRLHGTVWNAGGCRSYYLDRNGRNSTIFPGSTLELRRRLRFEPSEYALAA